MDNERRGIWAWLKRARDIDKEKDALEKAQQEARDAMTRITQNYETDGAQTSKDPHKFDRLAELDNLIAEKLAELAAVQTEILRAITMLENGKQRTVLIDYYVRCMTLEETAAEMHITFRHVLRIRKVAVQNLEKLRDGT